jgi:hypothetical protein
MKLRWQHDYRIPGLCFAIAVASCGKAAPAGSSARDDVIAMWKKGGLDASAFAAATTKVGTDCAAGTVNKLDVLICNYPTADAAKQAADAGLQWVGDTTGSSQVRGTLVIAVADHHKADPNGRTINQIFKLVPQ